MAGCAARACTAWRGKTVNPTGAAETLAGRVGTTTTAAPIFIGALCVSTRYFFNLSGIAAYNFLPFHSEYASTNSIEGECRNCSKKGDGCSRKNDIKQGPNKGGNLNCCDRSNVCRRSKEAGGAFVCKRNRNK